MQGRKRAWTRLFGPLHRSIRQLVEGSSPSCRDQSFRCTKSRMRNSSAGQYSFSGFGSTKVRTARSLALMRQSVGNLADAGAFRPDCVGRSWNGARPSCWNWRPSVGQPKQPFGAGGGVGRRIDAVNRLAGRFDRTANETPWLRKLPLGCIRIFHHSATAKQVVPIFIGRGASSIQNWARQNPPFLRLNQRRAHAGLSRRSPPLSVRMRLWSRPGSCARRVRCRLKHRRNAAAAMLSQRALPAGARKSVRAPPSEQ